MRSPASKGRRSILAVAQIVRNAQAVRDEVDARQEAAEAEWERIEHQFPSYIEVEIGFGPLPLGMKHRLHSEAEIRKFVLTTLLH